MITTILWVNLIGICLIILIAWWFWLGKTLKTSDTYKNKINITVGEGVYYPAIINARAGKNIQLNFFRKDAAPCSEWVIFPQLNKSFLLPLNQTFPVELSIDKPGEYDFNCQMNMYRGKLIVKK